MKRAFLALAALPLLAYAADVFAQNHLDRESFHQSVVDSAIHGQALLPFPPAFKAIPAEQRPAVVRALGQALRAFAGTEAFRAAYAHHRKGLIPKSPESSGSDSEIQAKQRAEIEKNYQEAMKMVGQLPEAQRAQFKQTMEQVHQQQLKMIDSGQTTQVTHAQDAAAMADYQKALKAVPPEDPKAGLKKALQDFLDQTADVDFNAQLVDGRRFSSPIYEQKPMAWKVAYRAGRPAAEAARAEAQAWLAGLQ